MRDQQQTLREVHLARRIAKACRDAMKGELRGSELDIRRIVGEVEGYVAFDIRSHSREYRIYIIEKPNGASEQPEKDGVQTA